MPVKLPEATAGGLIQMLLRSFLLAFAALAICQSASGAAKDGRPNLLLIVADDLGYADLGAYGGDIDTPNIDVLAAEGMLFTQFHTAPYCSPTRSMLLSGNNNHVAGVASQQQVGVAGLALAGYEASLSDRIAPLPRLLRDAGYDTYTVGKWHLGLEPEQSPRAKGFTRSFNLLDGGGSHFDDTGFENRRSLYREDGEAAEWPAGRYSTELYTDKLISYIEADRDDGRPFFAFAAYTSPHWPLQVPDDYLDRYAGRYDEGYDALRERRFNSLKEAGVVPLDAALPPRNPDVALWADLGGDEQRREARKMELYAAMVDNLDDHVGRLLDYLRNNGLYDNTLIVFMSDNGAAREDFYESGRYSDYLRENYDNAIGKMGTSSSFVSYGAGWAEAGSAPFRKVKGFMNEGGIVAPLMIAGPGVAARAVIDTNYVTVMDIAPTLLEIAGAHYPDDGSVRPMQGESMVAFLEGREPGVHEDDYVTVMSHRGQALARKGRWKIVTTRSPFSEDDFELYDVVADPGETRNLRDAEPEIYAEMLGIWREKRLDYGIVLPGDL